MLGKLSISRFSTSARIHVHGSSGDPRLVIRVGPVRKLSAVVEFDRKPLRNLAGRIRAFFGVHFAHVWGVLNLPVMTRSNDRGASSA